MMTGIWKIGAQRSYFRRVLPAIQKRLVSTSNKNKATATAAEVCKEDALKAKAAERDKNWVSYGFDYRSKAGDRNAMHSMMFVSVTLCLVVAGFFWAYAPDYNLRDWAQREAFLELRRREQKGLPPIDCNLIDPAKIVLPSDEELGDTDIII